MNLTFLLKTVKVYINYKLKKYTPFVIYFYRTFSCNLNCQHCLVHKKNNPLYGGIEETLSKNDIEDIIDQSAELGIPMFVVTGGEPLLRNDIEEIGQRIKRSGMYAVLFTNGTLITKDRAKKIVDSFNCVRISIDGLKDTHNKIRGEKWCFDRTVKGLEYLNKYNKEKKLKIEVHFVIQEDNKKEIENIKSLFKDKCDMISFIPCDKFENIFVSNPVLDKSKRFCHGGRLRISILPNGKMPLCLLKFDIPIGDVKKQNLKEVIKSDKIDKIIEKCPGCYMAQPLRIKELFDMGPFQLMYNLPKLIKRI